MGCDIHINVEQSVNGKWEVIQPPMKTYYPGETYEYTARKWYNERNYDLFAMLADVRNGSGFAGNETGTGFEFMSDPKGLPEDISFDPEGDNKEKEGDDFSYEDWKESEKNIKFVHLGDHSFTHFTLDELVLFFHTYIKDKSTRQFGIVGASEYIEFKENGHPTSWSGGIGGSQIKIVTPGIMEQEITRLQSVGHNIPTGLFNSVKDAAGHNLYTKVGWDETYESAAGTEWYEFLKEAGQYAPNEDYSKIRVIIGFDS